MSNSSVYLDTKVDFVTDSNRIFFRCSKQEENEIPPDTFVRLALSYHTKVSGNRPGGGVVVVNTSINIVHHLHI